MQLTDNSSNNQNTNWLNSSILVIDDQPDMGEWVMNAFDQRQMKLTTPSALKQALMKAIKHHRPFDTILINAQTDLPDLDVFIQELKTNNVYRQPRVAIYDDKQPNAAQFPDADLTFCPQTDLNTLKQQLAQLWQQRRETQQQQVKDAFRSKPTVLLVEDDQINQKVVKMMLHKLQCTVETAATGNQALEHAQNQNFDIILMDIGLPDMDGYDATNAIRAESNHNNSDTPIIAITAFISDRELNRCFDVGMDDIITKPVNLKDLQDAIAANVCLKQRCT